MSHGQSGAGEVPLPSSAAPHRPLTRAVGQLEQDVGVAGLGKRAPAGKVMAAQGMAGLAA